MGGDKAKKKHDRSYKLLVLFVVPTHCRGKIDCSLTGTADCSTSVLPCTSCMAHTVKRETHARASSVPPAEVCYDENVEMSCENK